MVRHALEDLSLESGDLMWQHSLVGRVRRCLCTRQFYNRTNSSVDFLKIISVESFGAVSCSFPRAVMGWKRFSQYRI